MNDNFNGILTDAEYERRLIAVTMIAVGNLSNQEIAAFNLAITGFGKVAEGNCSYAPALKAGLIKECGSVLALEKTKQATAVIINQRMRDGTFV